MDGYFLFLGAIEPKKNVSRLIDAYMASGSKRPLIIAGGLGWQFEGDVKRIQDERFLSYRLSGRAHHAAAHACDMSTTCRSTSS